MNAKKAATSRSRAAKGEEGVRYAHALEELERILEDLENDAIDVDELGERVKRASELIRLCRARLVQSKAEIEQVVADLDAFEQEGKEEDGESHSA